MLFAALPKNQVHNQPGTQPRNRVLPAAWDWGSEMWILMLPGTREVVCEGVEGWVLECGARLVALLKLKPIIVPFYT